MMSTVAIARRQLGKTTVKKARISLVTGRLGVGGEKTITIYEGKIRSTNFFAVSMLLNG